MRPVAIAPPIAPRMPFYPPGAPGMGQFLYGQAPPAIIPQVIMKQLLLFSFLFSFIFFFFNFDDIMILLEDLHVFADKMWFSTFTSVCQFFTFR